MSDSVAVVISDSGDVAAVAVVKNHLVVATMF